MTPARFSRTGRRVAACGAVLALATSPAACENAPPAYPAALVWIDTDLPAPSVLTRLQVDVFDEAGRWSDHRRFAFTRAEDWPASFGVQLRDDARATTVLLRVRGYAEGAERDYRGERPASTEPYVGRAYPTSLSELCEAAPDLPPHEAVAQIVGPDPLFPTTCDSLDNCAGSVAARVQIAKAGRYRFEALVGITSAAARERFVMAPTLHLVKDCALPMTTVACDARFDPEASAASRIEENLEPGTYYLVSGAWMPGSVGELALRWTPAAEWGDPVLPPPAPVEPVAAPLVRLVRNGTDDVTPATEPAPEATVDRLIRVRLTPGAPVSTHVTLRGACAGTSAKLAVRPDGTIDADASLTCTETGRQIPAPIATGTIGQTSPPRSESSTFAEAPCPAPDDTSDQVCVPGGAFVMGSQVPATEATFDEGPRRITAVRRFWMDRYELTVARYREAVRRGLALRKLSPLHPPVVNDGPIVEGSHTTESTFSTEPMGREQHPLTGILPDAAREICLFLGGDLPTEAQWERAASYQPGGRRLYPWGDDPGTCATVVERSEVSGGRCKGPFPSPVDGPELEGDVSALGIVGLGGNVLELVLGSGLPYDSACFRGAGVIDPLCIDPTHPLTVRRGSSWRGTVIMTRVSSRRAISRAQYSGETGFRCAYAEEAAP